MSTSIETGAGFIAAEPTTDSGMVARANELHRTGVVQQCADLFRIVAQIKETVRRKGEISWSAFVAQNFEFSLATADNYARIGRDRPNLLTPLGAVRHLHPSGKPGHQGRTKKLVSREEKMAPTADIKITAAPRSASIGSTSGTPKLISQKERETATDAEIVTNSADSLKMPEVTIEVAVNAIKTAVTAGQMSFPSCVAGLRAARANVALLRHRLTQAEQKLAETEGKVIETYRKMSKGARQ